MKPKTNWKVLGWLTMIAAAVLALAGAGTPSRAEPGKDGAAAPESVYEGAEKCKDCHDQDETGNQYNKWKATTHASAFTVLAGNTASAIAKERGIAEPQKSEQCLKCHITAYNAGPGRTGADFDSKQGVQCESCHGPGGKHLQARAEAAFDAEFGDKPFDPGADPAKYVELPPGEVQFPEAKTCQACHNQDSPTSKEEFKFDEMKAKIPHPDPRKKKDK